MGEEFEIQRARPDVQELRQELALKTAVLETSADPIFVLNRDGTIYEVNSAVVNVFGLTPQTLVGRDFSERIISPLCQESFRLSFDRLAATDSGPLAGRKIELSAICADRREIPIELTLRSIRLEDLTQYVVFARDVSEIRKTETLMRESEARFRRIFDSNMAPVYFWDIHGTITDANDAFLRLFGYTRKELASRTLHWRSLIPPGYEQIERQSLEQLLRSGVSATHEFECVHKDGRLFSVIGTAAMIDGSRERGVCLLIDTSQSRENARHLKDTAWMLREVLEKLPGYAFVKDTNTQFRFVNGTMAKKLGYTADEMVGKTAAELGLFSHEKNTVADKRVLLTGEPNSIEFITSTRSGHRLVKLERSPLRNAKGQIIGVVGVGSDMTEEVKREREYRDSLEILKLISDGVIEGVTLQDPAGKLTFSNATAQRLISPGTGDFSDTKAHWFTVDRAPFPPDRRPDRLVLEGAKEAEALIMIRHSGAEERWILQRSVALKAPSGEPTGILSIYRDLTEVRKLEDLSQQQSAVMRATFDAIALHDANGDFLFVNEAHEALYGYSQEEIKGKSWKILFSQDEIQRLETETLPKLAARGSWHGENLARKKDGTLLHQEVSMTATPNGGVVCAIRDLSEQKKEQNAKTILRTISYQLANTLDCGKRMEQLAVLLASEIGDFCRIDIADAEGNLSCSAVSHRAGSGAGPERQRPINRVAQAMQTGEVAFLRESEDCQAIQEATGVETRSALIAPLRSRGFALGSVLLVRHSTPYDLHDLTLVEEIVRKVSVAIENSRLYDRAQEAIASRDDFIAAVSHDLKNPLSAILLSTSFLIRTLDKNPENTERDSQIRNQLKSLERSAQRMNKLLLESLELARIESGRLLLEKQEYKIPTLVQEVLEDLAPMARAKNQALEKSCSISRITAPFDRDRIEQVLLTLVTNAIRYTPEGGMIRVTVQELEKEFLFSIADSGPGIPPEERNILFDRYRELNTQRVCQGVGLPLARGIIEAHGGKLWIDTESGPGTTLRFTIPLAKSVDPRNAN